LIGVSTRAAAESAARAGFDVTAVDAFGDLDQHPRVRSLSLPRDFGTRFTARGAARAARTIEADASAYLSNFENHSRAVEMLAAGRMLWGNPTDVLRRVRNPLAVADALRRRGLPAPLVQMRPFAERGTPDDSRTWMLKPLRSGGGTGVRPFTPDVRVPRAAYLQEFIDGTPASIVFAAASGACVPLGVSRQLVGDQAFGASGYRYCGNVLVSAADPILDDDVVSAAIDLARQLTEEFGLVGLNGIDVVVRDRVPYAIEVNPRWTASMELVERAYGVSMFGIHARACAEGALPVFDLARARQSADAIGTAVVFAREDLVAARTETWLDDPAVRDVPRPGERIMCGHPICSVVATGGGFSDCRGDLVRRAQAVYDRLARSATASNP
jgi:predicted ATP-grasp superfamily ATP-dependent carboligase